MSLKAMCGLQIWHLNVCIMWTFTLKLCQHFFSPCISVLIDSFESM